MRLKKLKIKNIRSYEDQIIEFPEGSLLFSGDVGSGKTTALLAIEYALFGLQPGQKGSSLLRNNSDSGEVTLNFEIDGEDFIIERHLKRDARSITTEYNSLTNAGECIELSVTELKSRVLTILGYPPEFIKRNNLLYRYTVYTPQEQMKQIVYEDRETRLNILRHVFGIDKYKRVRENTLILIASLKEESKLLQGELKSRGNDEINLRKIEEKIIELSSRLAEKELVFSKISEDRKKLENDIKELELRVKEKENLEKEVEKASLLIGSKKERIILIEKAKTELDSLKTLKLAFKIEEYESAINEVERCRKDADSLNAEYISLLSSSNALISNQKEIISKKDRVFSLSFCPSCLQNVSESHKHNILNDAESKISAMKNQINSLNEQKEKVYILMSKKKSDLEDLESKKDKMEIMKSKIEYIDIEIKKLEDSEKVLESLKKDMSLLEGHLHSLKENIFHLSKFASIFKSKNEELKSFFILEKNTEISIAEIRKELEICRNSKKDILELILDRKSLEKKLANILQIIDWFENNFLNLVSFIEVQVMLKLRNEFSKIFNKWFQMIAGESFEAQLDESFTPIILQGGIEMDYDFLSGGERTAVALAYRLSLNQTINSVLSQIKTKDLVILDEPTDGFSEAQINKIRDVLEELKIGQLIIVSHEQKIESFVDNIIRLKKTGDISAIETLPIAE